jgi:hypothetical protein
MLTNEQVLVIVTVISSVLVFLNARTTASNGAVSVLADSVETLRAELEAERKTRKQDKEAFEKQLAEERTERKREREQMEAYFEKERLKYQRYIKQLVESMEKAGIPVPEWDVENGYNVKKGD